MTLHEVVNVSLPRAVAGRQLFVPRTEALIESIHSLHDFLHGDLHFQIYDGAALLSSIDRAHQLIHVKLPAHLN